MLLHCNVLNKLLTNMVSTAFTVYCVQILERPLNLTAPQTAASKLTIEVNHSELVSAKTQLIAPVKT